MARKTNRRTILFGLGLLPGLTVGLLSCNRQARTSSAQSSSSAQDVSSSTSAPNKVTIAYQPGLGYFSLVIVKQQNVLEQQFPNTQFEWKALSSGSAIRDSMIANQIQVGGVGIAPFLIGWGRGVEWRLLSGLNQQDLWLVTKDPQIKSLKDFKPNQKIAVPAPDSIQAVTLRKGAQKELGDARALDANLVAMSQPDGLQALERGQVSAQLPAPPIQFQVVEHGGKAILRSSELFGGLPSGGSLVVMDSFYTQYPAFNQALYTAIENASKLMAEKPDDAAKLLAQDSEGKTTPAEAKQWITHKGVRFTTEPSGYLAYASFMQEAKMISKTPQSMEELVLPPLKGREGN